MTGGTSAPPDADAASTAAATWRRKPLLRIIGIVNAPVVTAFATALPEREPSRPLLSTATFAGPPGRVPKTRSAKRMMNCVAPDISRKAPNTTNRKT